MKKIDEFSSFATFETVGQNNNIPGMVGKRFYYILRLQEKKKPCYLYFNAFF